MEMATNSDNLKLSLHSIDQILISASKLEKFPYKYFRIYYLLITIDRDMILNLDSKCQMTILTYSKNPFKKLMSYSVFHSRLT